MKSTQRFTKKRMMCKLYASIDRSLSSRVEANTTLIVSGFWRSGTTWLQSSLAEILNAKTVYEPFHYIVPGAKQILQRSQFSKKDDNFLKLFFPYSSDHSFNGHPLHGFLDDALQANISGPWLRQIRNGIGEAFRSRIIMKFVRAQLCLRTIQGTFPVPAIHIYRDPRAIAGSLKWTFWNPVFDHLCLREQLLEQRDGRKDYFEKWREKIDQYDREDNVTRLVAYWAFTEKYLQDSYENEHGLPMVFLSYEELCRKRGDLLHDILKKLNVDYELNLKLDVLDTDSITTMKKREGVSVDEKISAWKKVLSNDEIAKIESMVQQLGLGDRLYKG